ncbi:MAG: hypothetical protein ACOYW7_11210 [Nitrospirota bacterium]
MLHHCLFMQPGATAFPEEPKFISLALAPVVAALIFIVSTEAFATLSASNGMIDLMIKVFVGHAPAADAPIMTIVGWFIRHALAVIIAPTVLALPAAKLIWQSERFANEVIGQGFAMLATFNSWSNVGALGGAK